MSDERSERWPRAVAKAARGAGAGGAVRRTATLLRRVSTRCTRLLRTAVAGRWWELVELSGVVAVTLWVAWPYLRLDTYITSFDTIAYAGPNHAVTIEALRALDVPGWNTNLFAGVAHLANPQTAAVYPLRLLVLPFDASTGLDLLAGGHLLVLAAGWWLLARWWLRLRAPAGLVAVLLGVASGTWAVRGVQYEQLFVLAWTPLLLLGIDAVLRSRRPWPAAGGLGLVVGLLTTAGHPQAVFTLVPFALVLTVARAADSGTWRRLPHLAAAGLLGAAIASAHLAPMADLAARSANTGGRPLANVADPAYVLDPASALVALLGDPGTHDPASLSGSYETSVFVGVAGLLLALVGWAAAVRRRPTRWTAVALAGSAVLGVLLAVGPRWPVYRWAYDFVPGVDQARVPGRWTALTGMAVALLAASGTDRLVRRIVDRRDAVVALAAAGVVVGLLLVPATGLGDRPVGLWLAAAAATVCAVGGLVAVSGQDVTPTIRPRRSTWLLTIPVVVLALELVPTWRWSPARLTSTPVPWTQYRSAAIEHLRAVDDGRVLALTFDELGDPAYLAGSLRPNVNATHGIRSIDGYDGGIQVTEQWVEAMSSLTGGSFDPDLLIRMQVDVPLDADRLARLGVRWALVETAVLPAEAQVPGWRGPVTVDDTVELWENPAYLGEGVLWPATRRLGDEGQVAELLASNPALPAALVDTDGPILECDGCPPAGVRLQRPANGWVVADVAGMKEPAVLAVAEQWDPGWRVTIDGRPASTLRVDGLVLGVLVPAGATSVTFTYRPAGWPAAPVVSLVATLVALAAVAAGGWQHRRERRLRSSVTTAAVEGSTSELVAR